MASPALKTEDEQFVTLGIDREVFAVPVETVLEILDMRPMFRIPDAPAYLAGLIDVRGRGVPVIDLRLRLGLPQVPSTENTRILVLEAPVAGRRLTLGLIADRVFEVTGLDDGTLETPPDIGLKWRSDHIRGVGRRNDNFVVVFDLAQLFSTDGDILLGANAQAGALAQATDAAGEADSGAATDSFEPA
jgi:purine-binding chemotaxis protein CheW